MIPSLLLRELATRPRRLRFHVRRVLFVLAGAGVLGLSRLLASGAGTSATGMYLFRSMSVSLLAISCILATLSAASAFMREREGRTLGLLCLTDVTSAELLAAKLWTAFVPTALGTLSILPLFLFLLVLGGVTTAQILVASLLLLSTAFLGNCLGLLVAAVARTEPAVRGLAALGALLVFAVLPAAARWACGRMGGNGAALLPLLSPFHAMLAAWDERTLVQALPNPLYGAGLGAALLARAWALLRRRRNDSAWINERADPQWPDGAARRTAPARRSPAQAPLANPVTWRDLTFVYGGRHGAWRLLAALAGLMILAVPVMHLLRGAGCGGVWIPLLRTLAISLSAGPMILFLFGCVFCCSQAFSREKRQRVFELLLITDLSVDQIFTGKLLAVFTALWPGLLFALIGMLVMAIELFASRPFLVIAFALDYVSMCIAYPFLALCLALRSSRHVALGICMLVFVLWNVVGRALFTFLLAGIGVGLAGFLVDFAFHVELVLLGSMLIEHTLSRIRSGHDGLLESIASQRA
jgi:hypothetical protein